MKLPDLKGSPKQVSWATAIRSDRLKVWRESSPEKFTEIEPALARTGDAGWWIAYRDKDLVTVYNHFREGVDLRKLQQEEWAKQQKKDEQKERAGVRSYLKKELEKEAQEKKVADRPAVGGIMKDGMLRFTGPAIDRKTGAVCDDPELPF